MKAVVFVLCFSSLAFCVCCVGRPAPSPGVAPVEPKGSVLSEPVTDRLMAYHGTILCINAKTLSPGLVTYPTDPEFWLRAPVLGKWMFSLEREGRVLPFEKAPDTTLKARFWGFQWEMAAQEVRLAVSYFPIMHGRDTVSHEGVAGVRIHASGLRQGDKLLCDYGGLQRGKFVDAAKRIELLSSDGFPGSLDDTAFAEDEQALIRSEDLPLLVGLHGRSSQGFVRFQPRDGAHGQRGEWIAGAEHTATLWLMAGFALEANKVAALLRVEPAQELEKTKNYFDTVAKTASVQTPDHNINEAFQWALLNLEYCYYKPLGWTESLDHWLSLWTMMYTRPAEALGQTQRSRDSLLAHAKHVAENGRMQDLDPSGGVREDFLWNHHFLWDIEHYLDWVGDLETLRKLYPAAKRATAYLFDTYDQNRNLLIGFDQQMGYQEDMICAYNDAGSASMAGAEMLRIMAKLSNALHKQSEADDYAKKAKAARENLKRELWSPPLGRYLNSRDPYGKAHWDGQYHTFAWPAMYGFTRGMDSYTSLRHMRDTLISPRGLVYVSNNFPRHMPHTTGCQEGALQSSIAAWGLCAGGMRDEGAAMFKACADLVMAPQSQGSFPEVAHDPGTWFSPTASYYMEGIIEGLFGISREEGRLRLQPAIPDSWDRASIRLPSTTVEIRQAAGKRTMKVIVSKPTPVFLRWALPMAGTYRVTVNGKTVEPRYEPSVKSIDLLLDLPPRSEYAIEVVFASAKINVKHPQQVVEGSPFSCSITGARIVGVEDPSDLLEQAVFSSNGFRARFRNDLITPFLRFGRLGNAYFSRRSLFLKIQVGEHEALWPVDVTLAPSNRKSDKPSMPKEGQVVHYEPIAIPLRQASKDWQTFRLYDDLKHMGWHNIADPLVDLTKMGEPIEGTDRVRLNLKEARGVPFEMQPGHLLVLSDFLKQPSVTIDVHKRARVLHFLVLPLLSNEDAFSEVAEIIVRSADHPGNPRLAPIDYRVVRRVLHHPGDLDNWYPPVSYLGYHSYGMDWTGNPAIPTNSATFNVIRVDLGESTNVDSITLRALGRYPAIGVVAISAQTHP